MRISWALHCPQAVCILDFPHAAQRLGEIAEAVQGAGTKLAQDWLAKELHRIKHHGPAQVLKIQRALRGKHPELEKVQENVAYLEKRQALQQQKRTRGHERTQQRLAQQSCRLLALLARLGAFSSTPTAAPLTTPVVVPAAQTGPKPAARPAPTYPWKGRCLPLRRAG